jgi:hypothetical protein
MCCENQSWVAPRIHGELLKLGIDIGETSVSKYIVRCRKPPSQTWCTFLQNHTQQLVSIDFFTVPTLRFQVHTVSTDSKSAWRDLYEAAVLETNLGKMQPCVQTAKMAINTRLHELQLDHGGTPEENQALSDALNGLKVLEREIRLHRHDSDRTKASDQPCDC